MTASSRARVPLLHRPLASYYLVVGTTAALLTVGLVMVLSASSVWAYTHSGSSFSVFSRQALWAGIGVPVFWIGSRLPVRLLRALGYPLLMGSVGLLLLVPVMGVSVDGATRWLDLGPIQLQPSELAKLAVLLWGADLFVRKHKLLGDWRHLLVPFAPVVMLIAVLIMAGRDLGSTMVLLVVAFSLLWVVGAPGRVMLGLSGLGVGAVGLLAITEPYRLQRLTSFLHPQKVSSDAGYQALQGLYALGSGGWFGVGLGASRQKWDYVPNAYTDFIFSIIGEELGLVGCLAVVTLFATLAYAGVRIARRTVDPFSRLVAGAITTWMIGQAVINMGAVIGLLPITGITLPLISFGGTSLVITMFALGLLAGVARREPDVVEALAARRARSRWPLRPRGRAVAGPARGQREPVLTRGR